MSQKRQAFHVLFVHHPPAGEWSSNSWASDLQTLLAQMRSCIGSAQTPRGIHFWVPNKRSEPFINFKQFSESLREKSAQSDDCKFLYPIF